MKKINLLLMLLPVLYLFGCADSHTTGTEKDTEVKVTIHVTQHASNTGDVNINPGVGYTSATGDTKQDTANTAETPTKVDLNLDDVNNPTTRVTNAVQEKTDNILNGKADKISPDPKEPEIISADNDDSTYEEYFDHVMFDPFPKKADGGVSLYSNPGQVWDYEYCAIGDVKLPRKPERDEHDREGYWNMKEAPVGDIICVKDVKNYKYPSGELWIKGKK